MIRTVPFFLGAILLSGAAYAQQGNPTVNEDFEDGLAILSASCWQVDDISFANKTTNPAYVLNANGSIYSDPPVNNSNFRTLATPFLDVAGTISVSFQYVLSSKLKNGATRIIQVGLVDKEGGFTLLDAVTLNHTSPANAETLQVSQNVTPGVYRVAIKMGGTQGDGNCRLIVDDLSIDAPYHYSAFCNPAPVATDDTFTAPKGGVFPGFSVTENDTDPDNENLKPVLVEGSPDGTITLNEDGTFLFIPNETFTGNTTSFNYKVVDDGYTPVSSNTARVTIEFVEPETTVMNLVSFSGKMSDHKVKLQWEVGFNEHIEYFEVEQSSNGVSFTSIKTILASSTEGDEKYEVLENEEGAGKLYRLKMVGRKGDIVYSATIKVNALYNGKKQEFTFTNPVVSAMDIRYTTPTDARINISIYNINGTIVYTWSKETHKGLNLISLPATSNLKPGSYVLTIINEQGEKLSSIFLKR